MEEFPGKGQVLELARRVKREAGDDVTVEFAAGVVRHDGADVMAAVAQPEDEDGTVYFWMPRTQGWRAKRELDPAEVLGLIEWRQMRDERSADGSEFDRDEYDPA